MSKKQTPAPRRAGTQDGAEGVSTAELLTRLCLLAQSNRPAYRAVREVMWAFVVENSARSDFPSDMS